MIAGQKIQARSFVQMLSVNVHNEKLSDAAFRELIANTLKHVEGNIYKEPPEIKDKLTNKG